MSMKKDLDISPDLVPVVSQMLREAEGRGLGVFHDNLDSATVVWSQASSGARISGYSFTDWEGRTLTGSQFGAGLGWTALRGCVTGPARVGQPIVSAAGLLALLAGATNGSIPEVQAVRSRSEALTEDERRDLRLAYEQAHADLRGHPWESVWSLAWLMIGVNQDQVSRPAPEEAAVVAAVLAAQARPYLRPSTAWTLLGYDLLSAPWRTVLGPIYPDDPRI
jgi:hypothetical protein